MLSVNELKKEILWKHWKKVRILKNRILSFSLDVFNVSDRFQHLSQVLILVCICFQSAYI